MITLWHRIGLQDWLVNFRSNSRRRMRLTSWNRACSFCFVCALFNFNAFSGFDWSNLKGCMAPRWASPSFMHALFRTTSTPSSWWYVYLRAVLENSTNTHHLSKVLLILWVGSPCMSSYINDVLCSFADTVHLIGSSQYFWYLLISCHRSNSWSCETELSWWAWYHLRLTSDPTFT